MTVLCNLMRQRFQSAGLSLKGGVIRRVIIEDASSQVMPKGNAEEFPAHANHHGPTAGAKIDLAYDLLSDEIISHSLQLATMQDKVTGRELITEIRQGYLVLRDMGAQPLAADDGRSVRERQGSRNRDSFKERKTFSISKS
jgi:hypothetical protein